MSSVNINPELAVIYLFEHNAISSHYIYCTAFILFLCISYYLIEASKCKVWPGSIEDLWSGIGSAALKVPMPFQISAEVVD